jgi:hypothetical protein
MATFLNAGDLSRFLRGRKSENCRIGADWVDDHQQDRRVQAAVDALERHVLRVADSVEMRHVAADLGRRGIRVGLNIQQADDARRSACLFLLNERYTRGEQTAPEAWEALLSAARHHIEPRIPAWAAAIMRVLRPASPTAPPPDEEEYTVEFLMLRRVRVRALDDIQAEREAAHRLTDAQREAVQKIRVLDAEGAPVAGDEGFWTPDKSWWDD